MKIGKFDAGVSSEVIVKVLHEALALFNIEITPGETGEIRVANEIVGNRPVVKTSVVFNFPGEQQDIQSISTEANEGENPRAEIHRLVKLNFYNILKKKFSFKSAPWGIMYGVRPGKIVERYIDSGLSREDVISRLMTAYDMNREKSELLTDVTLLQRKILPPSDAKTTGIYIGIPFCLSRCLYCSFPSNKLPVKKLLDRFMDALFADMSAAKYAVRRFGLTVESIYVGGGTPTALPDDAFDSMLRAAYDSFLTENTIEFTVEAGRPDSMTLAKLDAMARYGVTRTSVNPQSMKDRTLIRIGRGHTPDDILKMFRDFRSIGIKNINMDLILGLPGESTADVAFTLEKISALEPDEVTLHTLAIKRGSRLKDEALFNDLPDTDTVREMFALALGKMNEIKLRPYYIYRQGNQGGGLENIGCARPGAESVYNIRIMGERQTIIGIGGAASSKIINPKLTHLTASFNAKDLLVYISRVDEYIRRRAKLIEDAYS